MSTSVTLNGRLIKDPEMRYSAKGNAVTSFTVVTSDRYKDGQDQTWKDRNTTFWDVVCFGQMAESVAESLEKGDLVLVAGKAYQEEWEAKDGTKRRSLKVTADDVAPSLRWASAKITRSQRSGGDTKYDPQARPPADDPWASGPAASGGFSDAPPF